MKEIKVNIFTQDEGHEIHSFEELKSKNIRDVFIGDDESKLGIKFEHVGDDMFKLRYSANLENKIKLLRGLRAKSGKVIDEACNMSKEDIEKVLHKFDKPNKIDFESEISKRQENDNKKVETFNSVIKDNIEGIKNLFNTDYSDFIIGTISDGNGYLKLILKKTILPEDKGYEFGYIEERGDGHNLKEYTMNRLRNFITNIYCEDKI